MKLLPERISVLLFSELLLSFICFVLATLLTRGLSGLEGPHIWGLALAAASVVTGCFFSGLYKNLQWRSRVALTLQIGGVFGIALLLQGVLAWISSPLQVPRVAMLTGATLNFGVMVGWRILYARLLKKIFATEPVLFLGIDDVVREIAEAIAERPELGFSVAGFLANSLPPGTLIAGGGCIEGGIGDLLEVSARLKVKRIVAGMEEMRRQLPLADLVAAKRKGIAVQEAASAYELICGRVCSRTFRPSQIVFAHDLSVRPGVMAAQSVYSNLLGLALFLLAAPLLIIARVVIRLTSSGPAVLTEQYAGLNGIPFLADHLRCTRSDDPSELTAVGRWIRALHMEYLPRIANVVRGEMSLVGPEPVRLEYAEYLSSQIPIFRQRSVVKPGLTGWTQIQNEESGITEEIRRIEFDLYYTKYMSVPLDAYILLRTLRDILPFEEE